MARRAPGALLPLELDLLAAGLDLARDGQREFHGYAVAVAVADGAGARRLTAHGTLYKALGRLADAGLLESRWEEPEQAEREGRPRRRLYRVTGAGAQALSEGRRPSPAPLERHPGRAARPAGDASPA